MATSPLEGRAAVALGVAMYHDADSHRLLEDYLAEMTDNDLDALYKAAQNLADTVSYICGRRQ